MRGNNPDETLMIAVKALDRAEFSVSPFCRIARAREEGSNFSVKTSKVVILHKR